MRTLSLLTLAFGLVAGSVHAQEVLQELASPNQQARGYFGHAVAGVPDADGDGRGDLLVGAYWENNVTGPADAGRAYLYSGATGLLLHPFVSPDEQASGIFGDAVAGVADVDGDGRGDLLVGATGEEGYSGRVYVYSGATGALLYTLATPDGELGAGFGGAVSGVPDADGDDVADLLVGAASGSGGGRAFLFGGATGTLLHTLASPNARPRGEFGVSVSGIPDADGDGRGDLLIGAWQEGVDSKSEAGQAYVFSGATGLLLYELVSGDVQGYGYFGKSVSGVPDTDGDGRGDVLVGAYGEGPEGRAYVFSGATGALRYAVESPAFNFFGEAVAGVPDADGDGRGDFVVGASIYAGRGYVFSGASGEVLYDLRSPSNDSGAGFGNAVAGVPDANGDGRGDLLIGAQQDLNQQGRAYLFSGGVGAALAVDAEPVDGPIVLPPSGGTFSYTVTTTNTASVTQTFQLWTRVTSPIGQQTPVLRGPITRTLAPGASVTDELRQSVPGGGVLGEYTYTAYVGTYPSAVAASDAFVFTKALAAVSGRMAADEAVWEASAGANVAAGAPAALALHGPRPNPSSSRTALTFDLPEASAVRLAVYDVLGREVAVLVDGEREAGRHEAAFDGSSLPSGVYVVRLAAGSAVLAQRLTLVR